MDQRSKKCRQCGELKTPANFASHPSTKDRLATNCRACDAERLRARAARIRAANEGRSNAPQWKRCPKCDETKASADFGGNVSREDGLSYACKSCTRDQANARYGADPVRREANRARLAKIYNEEPERYLNYRYRNLYGITLERYNALLESQGGGCAICGNVPAAGAQRLAVDHDHRCCPSRKKSCGECVRGLLCGRCNRGLGYFDDDADMLGRAASYLDR